MWQKHRDQVLNKLEVLHGVLHRVVKDVAPNNGDQAVFNAILYETRVPGLGPTYATKILRFFWPNRFPALDSHLSLRCGRGQKDGGEYALFAEECRLAAIMLTRRGIINPMQGGNRLGRWFAADVEMALFAHVQHLLGETTGSYLRGKDFFGLSQAFFKICRTRSRAPEYLALPLPQPCLLLLGQLPRGLVVRLERVPDPFGEFGVQVVGEA